MFSIGYPPGFVSQGKEMIAVKQFLTGNIFLILQG